jgi:hypothetical protein
MGVGTALKTKSANIVKTKNMNKEQLVQKVIAEVNSCYTIQELSKALPLIRLILPTNGITTADKKAIYDSIVNKEEELLKSVGALFASVARSVDISIELDLQADAPPIEFVTHEGCGTEKATDFVEPTKA